MSEIPLETLLEATLFSAGRSLSVQELSENLGYEDEEILESMNNLQSTIKRRRGGGLQIVEIGGKWAMEVKPGIADHLPKETKSELPPKLIEGCCAYRISPAYASITISRITRPKSLRPY